MVFSKATSTRECNKIKTFFSMKKHTKTYMWRCKRSQRRQHEEIGAGAHRIPHAKFKETNTRRRRGFLAIVRLNVAVSAVRIKLCSAMLLVVTGF